MLSEAAWKSYDKRIAGKTVTIDRGQLCASIRFMAEAWGWHPAKVQRFIDALKTDTMVKTATDAGAAVITICNYNEYQKVALPGKTETDTPTDTAAIQQRYSSDTNYKEGKEGKEGKKKEGGAGAPADFAFVGRVIRLMPDDYERWRKSYYGIDDLPAELTKADDFYWENPPDDGKWFYRVSRWLDRAHQAAVKEKNENDPWRGVDISPPTPEQRAEWKRLNLS